MDEDSDSTSTQPDIEDAMDPNAAFGDSKVEFEGPELDVFSIDEVAADMDGQHSGEGVDVEGGHMTFNIDLDVEVNPDSDIDEIDLSDVD
jgi:hypothetical protein